MKSLRKRALFKAMGCKYKTYKSKFSGRVGFVVTIPNGGGRIVSPYSAKDYPQLIRVAKNSVYKRRERLRGEG